jgi:uncharacterized protein (TIGR03437 family)
MRTKLIQWLALLSAVVISPLALFSFSNGGPYGYTGYGSEPTCEASGCHRSAPFPPGAGRVSIDVGPYVPGQTQTIVVRVFDVGAKRWGFQLAARRMNSPQTQAGSFSLVPDYSFVRIGCADQTSAPCSGSQLQYASQTSLGTQANTPDVNNVGITFRVNWTAPTSDVGPVLFTAAGMGADGDMGPGGDHTYTTTATSLFAASNLPTLSQGGIVNAATFSATGGISSGALVTLFGQNLAPPGFSRTVTTSDLDLISGKLPIELSRTGVDFFAPGNPNAMPAYMVFVNERQINVQVPALPAGSNQVQAQVVFNRGQGPNEVRGNMVSANVGQISPGLFTIGGNLVAALNQSFLPISRINPAHPGDVIFVYGTGFGATSPAVEPGSLAPSSPLANLTGSVSAQIGGLALASSDIFYSGAAPNFAGLQQFNLRVPTGVASGDQTIVLSEGGLSAQPGVILVVQPR